MLIKSKNEKSWNIDRREEKKDEVIVAEQKGLWVNAALSTQAIQDYIEKLRLQKVKE